MLFLSAFLAPALPKGKRFLPCPTYARPLHALMQIRYIRNSKEGKGKREMENQNNITTVKRWKKVRAYTVVVSLEVEGEPSTLIDIRHSLDGVDAIQWAVYWRLKYGSATAYKIAIIGRDLHVPTGTNCKDGERLMFGIFIGDTQCKEFDIKRHEFTTDRPNIYRLPPIRFAQNL